VFVFAVELTSLCDLQYKVCSWIAIIFCAQSLANMKNFENDLKQLSMAFM
jgi:hypothetical protein